MPVVRECEVLTVLLSLEEDTIRILVATDNHVGYEERDPTRGDDSWKTFDEVLNLAKTQDVSRSLLRYDLRILNCS